MKKLSSKTLNGVRFGDTKEVNVGDIVEWSLLRNVLNESGTKWVYEDRSGKAKISHFEVKDVDEEEGNLGEDNLCWVILEDGTDILAFDYNGKLVPYHPDWIKVLKS